MIFLPVFTSYRNPKDDKDTFIKQITDSLKQNTCYVDEAFEADAKKVRPANETSNGLYRNGYASLLRDHYSTTYRG